MTELNFILYFLDSIFLQGDIFGIRGEGPLGSADPIVKGMLPSAVAVIGFSIMLNLFNAGVRKKQKIQVHEQNEHGNDADEYATYVDNNNSTVVNFLLSNAFIVFIHCSCISNSS
jgi:hypothetical protein